MRALVDEGILLTEKDEEFESIKLLAYKNWENEDETEIGFEYKGQWITNPFVEESGRFEFTDFDTMCKHYGADNIISFINAILNQGDLK